MTRCTRTRMKSTLGARDPVLPQFSSMKEVCSASAYARLGGSVTSKIVWMHAPSVSTSSSQLRRA